MVGCITEVLTFLLTPIWTYVYRSNDRCKKCHICHIWHVWCSDIHHMYVCQYGWQKKRKDLRNAANHLKYPTQLFLRPKIEKSHFLIFSWYFSEFPLYILAAQYQKEQVLNDKLWIFLFFYCSSIVQTQFLRPVLVSVLKITLVHTTLINSISILCFTSTQ